MANVNPYHLTHISIINQAVEEAAQISPLITIDQPRVVAIIIQEERCVIYSHIADLRERELTTQEIVMVERHRLEAILDRWLQLHPQGFSLQILIDEYKDHQEWPATWFRLLAVQ